MIIHGGPFASAPSDIFLQMRTQLLMMGLNLIIVNYRGSVGYGNDFLNSLLGNIGSHDVDDCYNLLDLALKTFPEYIDSEKVGVYGGSHGGFLTGWLIGHPEYRQRFKAACLWNPVINMSYMYSSTDIPDWIVACCLNKPYDDGYKLTSDDNKVFFDKSPISVVENVTTPSLIIIGGSDKRVPPH
jgi:acylaminoacyl-peptidase